MTTIARRQAHQTTLEFRERFALDVQDYLTRDPRQLPSRYLYDAIGSALFEAICQLPWYPLTRAESRLLETHARAILDGGTPVSTIVELGPGNGAKLAILLHAAGARRRPLGLHLIDVSSSALAQARLTLEPLGVEVIGHEATYEAGLVSFAAERPEDGPALAMFLGSNIGNFDPPGREALLRAVRRALEPADMLLLGTDLVKPERDLVRAYDDPLGVTAAFNRNLLVRINRELGGDFDLAGFVHRAVWNHSHSRVEMHLVSRRNQHVTVPAADLDFQMAEGESIWTESSYKYAPEEIQLLLDGCGFRVDAQWIDTVDRFALTYAQAV